MNRLAPDSKFGHGADSIPDAPDAPPFFWHSFEEAHPDEASNIRDAWMDGAGWRLIDEMIANEKNHHALIYLGCEVGKQWKAFRQKHAEAWLAEQDG